DRPPMRPHVRLSIRTEVLRPALAAAAPRIVDRGTGLVGRAGRRRGAALRGATHAAAVGRLIEIFVAGYVAIAAGASRAAARLVAEAALSRARIVDGTLIAALVARRATL